MDRFEGLIAAPFTPMNGNGEVLYDLIGNYYDFLEKNKIVGAFVNGSTGESASLTQIEKMKLVEAWTAKSKIQKTLKIISLVGGTSYGECIEIAKHSSECGVDAVALVAPYYFKPSGVRQLAEFCAQVAESVPDTPFYYYHIPVLSGCFISVYDFLKEAAPIIPNLAGVKFTHEDFMDFLSCINFMNGKYEILGGRDENLLSALVLGTRAAVGSTYNYAAPLYNQLIDAYNSNDFYTARKLQQKSIDMIRLLGKYGGMGVGKAFMKYIGFDCGKFRLPVKNLIDSDYENFNADVDQLDMKQHFSII